MKQLFQSLKDGEVMVEDVPAPSACDGGVMIETSASLLSAGTERMLAEFGRSGWIKKVASQPERVQEVLSKARVDGPLAAFEAVASKLNQPVTMGYCNVGRVLESRTSAFGVGDLVVSNGPHAGVVSVPRHLCAKVPDGVSEEDACFVILASIGLQGIRLAEVTLGERVVVTGLGLIGLLTVQLLKAHGCQVLGIDYDQSRLELARSFGAEVVQLAKNEDPIESAEQFSTGEGVDAVIITASTTSDEPVSQAARMCRKRGRVVLVGVAGLNLNRSDFYDKEISFKVSCSYGPGRYDENYERFGHDYPIGFVRWTENRNFMAILDLMKERRLNVTSLISHRFPIERGAEGIDLLASSNSSLGIILTYGATQGEVREPLCPLPLPQSRAKATNGLSISVLGAGNYASRILIPGFQRAGAHLHTIVSENGVNASHFGRKYDFKYASSDYASALSDDIDAVVIATRHETHARLAIEALDAGKHVYCEKPLCLNLEDLEQIKEAAIRNPQAKLVIGFNRRFAPLVAKMKYRLCQIQQPKNIVITVNAGHIPKDHWTQQTNIGGGRIIGEACHFIDLARFLVGAPISKGSIISQGVPDQFGTKQDKAMITLAFSDGSIAAIQYLASGHKSYPKERVEVFTSGRVLRMTNYLYLENWGFSGMKNIRKWRQDKGADALIQKVVTSFNDGAATPIPQDEIFENAKYSIELSEGCSS